MSGPRKLRPGIPCPYCDGAGHISIEDATVGAMLLGARKAAKMTQADVASRVGLSRAQIANIEIGRSDIPIKTLARFAEAFGCSMKDLVP